jgi:hypothetical protein
VHRFFAGFTSLRNDAPSRWELAALGSAEDNFDAATAEAERLKARYPDDPQPYLALYSIKTASLCTHPPKGVPINVRLGDRHAVGAHASDLAAGNVLRSSLAQSWRR